MSQNDNQLQECPDCKQDSLKYDSQYKLYECQDERCKRIFNQRDLDRKSEVLSDTKPKTTVDRAQSPSYLQRIGPAPAMRPIASIKKFPYSGTVAIISICIIVTLIMIIVVYPLVVNPPLSLPTQFRVTEGNMQNTVTWEMADSFDEVVIVCSTTAYPESADDGEQIYRGSGARYVHEPLDNNQKYYYAIWSVKSVNGVPQYSATNDFMSGTPYWEGSNGEPITEYVDYGSNYRVAGADGNWIELTNNIAAEDPSWKVLRSFLRQDQTDREIYDDDLFVCGDFAEMLHNNAEEAGVRTAYVVIFFEDEEVGHTCNLFNTTDRGLVYIDCTGSKTADVNADKEVQLTEGKQYSPFAVFPVFGGSWGDMGIVEEFWVVW